MTVSEVKGFGKERAANAIDKVVEGTIDYAKKTKLEIVVPDHLVEKVIKIIESHSHTGRAGDGKIFVSTVDEVIKIRTHEKGEQAV